MALLRFVMLTGRFIRFFLRAQAEEVCGASVGRTTFLFRTEQHAILAERRLSDCVVRKLTGNLKRDNRKGLA